MTTKYADNATPNYNSNGKSQYSIKDGFTHTSAVRNRIEDIQKKIETMKENKIILKEEINHLSEQVNCNSDDLKKNILPIIENTFLNMRSNIDFQEIENKKLQQLIIELKKEKAVLQNKVISYAKKCAELEQELGKYPVNVN